MKKGIRNLAEKNKEILLYLFWGIMTTLVSWATYGFFVKVLPPGSNAIPMSNAFSWICAVLFAFVTNKLWVFRSRNLSFHVVFAEFWKFTASRLATGALEMIGVPLLVSFGLDQKIFGIDGMFAKVIISIVVVILNYIFSKFIAFKR
ncbi:GtrA family protein [Mediterraneibacter catenae]|uniref:GtrA family protein n=1 Tax=Mediterraneibacter catenae TaxID=2594882 RepID=A0A5M9I285_9FIRM|nr:MULTISPECIES: GtrA family protein [Mediterraneibacter]KAA8501405.1 GtrA family protein [Mediterraneibacter catenae]MDN0043526.1 GtrA family protein [Mediterraneibacter glycyrrhizinilyticus]OUO31211.1 hypothetical protein B5F86_01715 [Lachnoclostridium sp. An298]